MNTSDLKRFGLALAEAEQADRRAIVANSMSRGRAQASTTNAENVVQGWSSVLNKGMDTGADRALPGSADLDLQEHQDHVLGPDSHIQFIDEAVEASVEKVMKLPVSKVTELRKYRSGGIQFRGLKVGGETIALGPMDWSSVLAVVTGKSPKTVVADGAWSFGKSNSDDIVRIRSVRWSHTTVIGEISAASLYKLV